MRKKKLAQEQRISRVEKVLSQTWALTKMMEKEIKILQDKLKSDEEE